MKNTVITLIALFMVGTIIVGCNNDVTIVNGSVVDNTDYTAEAEFHHDIGITSQIRLQLEGVSGDITVTGRADFDSVIIDGVRQVGSDSQEDAEEHLPLLEVEVQISGEVIQVETHQPENSNGRSYMVNYEITVPDDFSLQLSDVNGTIEVESIFNSVVVSNVNGLVNLNDITGSVTVSLVNGLIDGTVVLPPGGFIAMSTVNGNIELNIPSGTSAEFEASVVNGVISLSGLDLHDEEISNNSVSGTLGDGNGTIGLSAVNGNVVARGE
jgi:DUF4097 and DUF4098 domain-containing protein YvlB